MDSALAPTPYSETELVGTPNAGPEVFRREVMRLQEMLLSRDDKLSPDTDCPVRHIFAPGAYAREITLPKGALVIGKIHRHAHLNFITRGKVRVLTESGTRELTAPCTFVSEVGTKRVVYAIEETLWTTVHVTNETDLEKIEEFVIAKNYEDLGAPALEKDEKWLGLR